MATLAIRGGTPYRTEPFPPRAPFGDREVELVTDNRVTFGRSGFPFTSPYVREPPRYDESLCPRAQEALDHMVILRVVESYDERDVDDMAGAIAKVAELLPPDREPS